MHSRPLYFEGEVGYTHLPGSIEGRRVREEKREEEGEEEKKRGRKEGEEEGESKLKRGGGKESTFAEFCEQQELSLPCV